MILEQFDPCREAILNAEMEVDTVEHFPEITVACFSEKLFTVVLKTFHPDPIFTLGGGDSQRHVYRVHYAGNDFAFYRASMGEPVAIMEYEVLLAAGSKRLILFGTCGVLDRSIEDCGIIIPTEAIRDEGCSYHYAPAGDLIEVNHLYREMFREVLTEHGLSWTEGITWTTDAVYRETRKKIDILDSGEYSV